MQILILNFILSTAVGGKIIRRPSNQDTMIYNMARGFVKSGHNVTLAAAEEFLPTENESDPGFDIIYFKSRITRVFKPALLPWPKGLGKYLRYHSEFDMILSVETFSFPTIIAARHCRKKLLVWQEMAFMQHMLGGLPAKLWYNVIAPFFIKDAPVVAQSEKAKEFIRHYLPNVTDTIVGHGSNSDLFYPSENSEEYFVVISMLVKRKRIDRILQKFARFIKNTSRTNYTLKIIGEGPEEHSLKKQAEELGISQNIKFEGFLEHSTIAAIGRKAKALLIDTQQDNNMVTIPESIVNGTPVLTNKVPNNSVFISEYGLGIAKDNWDWQDLEQMIIRYDEFHDACISHRHKFSNDGCAAILHQIYINKIQEQTSTK